MNPDLAGDRYRSLKGRDMGEHAGLGKSNIISDQLDKNNQVDVAILATVRPCLASARKLFYWLKPGFLLFRLEELFYPFAGQQQEWSEAIIPCAKIQFVVGTGVNRFDGHTSWLHFTVCNHIDRIEVHHYPVTTIPSRTFSKKIGAGLSFEEFERRKNEGKSPACWFIEVDASSRINSGWHVEKDRR